MIREFGKTVILVSHDRDEVYRMSDSIAVIDNGKVQVMGSRQEVFDNPQTRRGAVLTGCKNVSTVEQLPDGRYWAREWGMALHLPNAPEDMTAVGVRMKYIQPGPGENTCRCRVVEEIENPFSYTIMLEPEESAGVVPIGWELPKPQWEAMRADVLEIHIPVAALLPLRDDQ